MKEKTITIGGAPFTYMDEEGDPYVFNPMTTADMEETLRLVDGLLKECGIPFCLTFGTLLGAVREGYFIKGDEDVDIIVTDEEKLYNSLPFLRDHGLFVNRIFPKDLYQFHTEGRRGHFDIYILHPIDHWPYRNWCVSIRGHYAPKRFFERIEQGKYFIGDTSYPYPANPEALLEWWYGKTWRIPQSRKATEDVWLRRLWLFPSWLYGKIVRKVKRLIKR